MNTTSSKKNRVWSDVLIEQTLCDNILKINNLETTTENEIKRDTESYAIQPKKHERKRCKSKKKKRLNEKPRTTQANSSLNKLDKKILDQIKTEYSSSNQSSSLLFKNKIQVTPPVIIDDTCLNVTFDETKDRSHIRASEFDSDDIVCKEIVRQLYEKKSDLIMRCVKILGRKKSLELLYATQDIEDKGGMFTDDGFRRRTPGGIYIQLVKKDMTILSVQKTNIFVQSIDEKKAHKKRKRLSRKLKMGRMRTKLMKDDADDNDKTTKDEKEEPEMEELQQ